MEPFSVLGCGTVGTVYALPSTFNSPRTLKTGRNAAALRTEFAMAREIFSLYARMSNSALFISSCIGIKLPRIPLHHAFYDTDSKEFWGRLVENSCGSNEEHVAGIEMDRVPPMPAAVGSMLIRRYFEVDKIHDAFEQREQERLLVQLYFGRSTPQFETPEPRFITKSRVTSTVTNIIDTSSCRSVVSTTNSRTSLIPIVPDLNTPQYASQPNPPYLSTLHNLPAPLPLLKEHLRTHTHKIVASIGAGYALMHWGCHIDGFGTEFVLGGGKKITPWLLDFDKCRQFDLPIQKGTDMLRKIIDQYLIPAIKEGGYAPRSGEEDGVVVDETMCFSPLTGQWSQSTRRRPSFSRESDINTSGMSLWETWKESYITVGRFCCNYIDRPDLIKGPEMACDALATAVELERMGLDDPEDMIVFEDDGAGQEDGLGWGSDDEDSDDDEISDEEDNYNIKFPRDVFYRNSSVYGKDSSESDTDSRAGSDDQEASRDLLRTPDTSIPDCEKECEATWESFVQPETIGDSYDNSKLRLHSQSRGFFLDFEEEAWIESFEMEDPGDDEELIISPRTEVASKTNSIMPMSLAV